MNLAALRHAGFSGLANRSLQAFSRALDRAAITAVLPRFEHLDPAPTGRARFLDATRFFVGASDPAVGTFIADALPIASARIRAAAESAVSGRFDLLGYEGLDFGTPIDWHLDPVSGRRAPYRHWSLINPLDYTTLGDHKVTWELNRHQWLVDFGQAWRMTGDPRYVDAFVAAISSWMKENRPGLGINWVSSLEAAYRLVSWCWAMFLFRDAPAFENKLRGEMCAWIRAHALHVERYLSYYYSPNTHLTGEALGLFYAGTAFPDLPGAKRWRRLGQRILCDEIERQVYADGVYFEQAACYQRYTAEIYLHFMVLAARNGIRLPEGVGVRVQRLLDALMWLRGPDGLLPAIGDDDGGVLTRVAGRAPRDPSGVFAVAAVHFGRADYAWAANGPQPETAWLLGIPGIEGFDRLAPALPNGAPSRLFDEGGYAVMRSDWRRDGHQMIVDVGPLGCPISGGHGHADLLSVHCHVFGIPAIVDPGTGSYPIEAGWRTQFRETAVHSTVAVDGASQAQSTGPFSWRTRCGARVERWESNEHFDLVDARHDAYRRLADPVSHRRRVVFIKAGFWIVVDDLEGTQRHEVGIRFQLAKGSSVKAEPRNGRAEVMLNRRCGLTIQSCSDVPVEMKSVDGWVSPAYGRCVSAPAVTLASSAAFPLRVVTILLPWRDGDIPAVPSWHRTGDLHRIELDAYTVVIDDEIRIEEAR